MASQPTLSRRRRTIIYQALDIISSHSRSDNVPRSMGGSYGGLTGSSHCGMGTRSIVFSRAIKRTGRSNGEGEKPKQSPSRNRSSSLSLVVETECPSANKRSTSSHLTVDPPRSPRSVSNGEGEKPKVHLPEITRDHRITKSKNRHFNQPKTARSRNGHWLASTRHHHISQSIHLFLQDRRQMERARSQNAHLLRATRDHHEVNNGNSECKREGLRSIEKKGIRPLYPLHR
jgi:hypothetical protein